MLSSVMPLHEVNPIAACFSQAACSYDSAAHLQREVGQQLLQLCPPALAVQHWLDLGCGTGFFSQQLAQRYPQAQGCGVDIAQGMLQHAQRLRPYASYLCADAQALPLVSNSVDLIFSSMALQWCDDFAAVLAEAKRVLKPNGIIAFTSVAEGTLCELKHSWQAVDGQPHINQFRRFADYQQLCETSGLTVVHLRSQTLQQHFSSVRALSQNLKQLGAHHVQTGRNNGLTSRQQYMKLTQAYEQQRQPLGLPVTWQMVYAALQAV